MSFSHRLHQAIHRIPGVPAHAERPSGHQGTAFRSPTHAPPGPPRFLPGWQRRIAALFGREV
ncbi:hypothetical protein KOI35_01470 [Actinoplanes bogorensis]|uniref:Uncharacterized protein n=1 Tax=Paractinoplanes bogorensis TaxID=1610840 RepID=A0ABS5YFS5_9ACTN|nr:hypothetical protein [Actinoplanes bogorensis]MBU2662167.1 hypothetical protein [Actinoplanes bogorensis]